MTFSLLAQDPGSGAYGGVAATGNLCVGAWVLRGDGRAGMTASQGLSPSTLWGEDALARMIAGEPPDTAIARTIEGDPGRASRQIAAIGASGPPAAFDGRANHDHTGHMAGADWIAAGNWLSGPDVLSAAVAAFAHATGPFPARLIAAAKAGVAAGSDRRGTLSSALLVVARDAPPLSLRVDHDADPVARLAALYQLTEAPAYRHWLASLPTRAEPFRA